MSDKKKTKMNVPKNWRQGQFIFNFLEWLNLKGVPTNQSDRMADPFYLSDYEWFKYLEEYQKEKNEKTSNSD